MCIANPAANRGANRAVYAQLARLAAQTGHIVWMETKRPRHATEIASQARGYRSVIAVGGDGTVHETVNGLMQIEDDVRPALGVLPIGTGNDFALSAGFASDDPMAHLQRLIAATAEHAIDVARVSDEYGYSEFWNNTLGIGFDAQANLQARRIKLLRGFPLYFVAVVRTIARHFHAADMQLDFDGETQDASVMMLSLGNGAREGGGFMVTPEARLDDGLLDTATVRQLNRLQMLMLLPRVMNGTHITSPHVKMNRVKTLRVKMNHALPIHIDGEIFSDERSRELTIETLAGQLRVITLH